MASKVQIQPKGINFERAPFTNIFTSMRSTALSFVIAMVATAFLSEQAAAQADYFQQTVDHEIDVALDDAEHILRGDIATRYTNNSGDTLEFIWIHLWPNAYKNGQTALAQQKFRQGEMFMFWAVQRDLGAVSSRCSTLAV